MKLQRNQVVWPGSEGNHRMIEEYGKMWEIAFPTVPKLVRLCVRDTTFELGHSLVEFVVSSVLLIVLTTVKQVSSKASIQRQNQTSITATFRWS